MRAVGQILGADKAAQLLVGHGEIDPAPRARGHLAHLGEDDECVVREIPGVGVEDALGEALNVEKLLLVLPCVGQNGFCQRFAQGGGVCCKLVERDGLAGDGAEGLAEVVVAAVRAAGVGIGPAE